LGRISDPIGQVPTERPSACQAISQTKARPQGDALPQCCSTGKEAVQNKAAATVLILVGLFVEVFMSAGVVCGIHSYSLARRLLEFKRGQGACAVLEFFLEELGFGRWFSSNRLRANASSIAQFLAHPTIESHPYRLTPDAGAVRDVTDCRIGLPIPVTRDGIDIRSPRFARYVLSNAELEALACRCEWATPAVCSFKTYPTTPRSVGSKGKACRCTVALRDGTNTRSAGTLDCLFA